MKKWLVRGVITVVVLGLALVLVSGLNSWVHSGGDIVAVAAASEKVKWIGSFFQALLLVFAWFNWEDFVVSKSPEKTRKEVRDAKNTLCGVGLFAVLFLAWI